ncbi:hypothetical protein GIB67_029535 [Kingdonia uniflora]|uniref:Uncharacterized protein n=1 Tax=Kingdonia uniflora TaxID=39325 RepID=A0A7J7NY67_9MAGN|nr:hypothetical protein GIB67_029535 [Kingdonia uniflora]
MRKDNVACVTSRENVPKRVFLSNKMGYSSGASKTEETDEDSSMHAKRSVGRFFYENGIDFSVVKSPSFLRIISAAVNCGSGGYDMPQCNELSGWILQEEKKEIDYYLKEVKHSWGITGISILLDG